MPDTPTPPAPLKKLTTSTVLDRASYIFSGMGLLGLLLSPAATVFLRREADSSVALLIGVLLLVFAVAHICAGVYSRRLSQRMFDQFVASHDCECELCNYVKRTPNTSWAKRDTQ